MWLFAKIQGGTWSFAIVMEYTGGSAEIPYFCLKDLKIEDCICSFDEQESWVKPMPRGATRR